MTAKQRTDRQQYDKKRNQTAKRKAYMKKYQQSAKRKAYKKKYQQSAKHKAYMKKYAKKYQQSAKYRAYKKKYQQTAKYRALKAAHYATKKAKRFGAPGIWTGVQFLALCKKHGNVCLCCHKKRKLTPDHVVPFCKGGTNRLSNIQPLCWPCNYKKHDKTTDYRKTKSPAK